MKVEKVFHRKDAIWPFTVVGRPPQEDTTFGEVIHDLTGAVIPTEIPGSRLLMRLMRLVYTRCCLRWERAVPFQMSRPAELLTLSNAILGKGQLSLAKYLLIADAADKPDIHDIPQFLATYSSVLTGAEISIFRPRRRSTPSTIPAKD